MERDASHAEILLPPVVATANSASNDIDLAKLSITGYGTTYTLTSVNVEIIGASQFTVALNVADRTALATRINQNGTSSLGAVAYNLAAAQGWPAGVRQCGGTLSGAAPDYSYTTAAVVADCSVGVVFTSLPLLDIDGSDTSTKYDVATDGILLLRYLLGYRDVALTSGVLDNSASVRNATEISNHIATYRTRFDVDGDGNTWALTDGLMILRRLLLLSGAALTAGAKNSNRLDTDIEIVIDTLMP